LTAGLVLAAAGFAAPLAGDFAAGLVLFFAGITLLLLFEVLAAMAAAFLPEAPRAGVLPEFLSLVALVLL
jgi:uncharacterized membrane protein YjjP (DUF1212 family)